MYKHSIVEGCYVIREGEDGHHLYVAAGRFIFTRQKKARTFTDFKGEWGDLRKNDLVTFKKGLIEVDCEGNVLARHVCKPLPPFLFTLYIVLPGVLLAFYGAGFFGIKC